MTYDQLTQVEKNNIAEYDRYLRGVLSSLIHTARAADPAHYSAFASQSVDPILAELPADDIIPNSTNLTAAQDLTVAEFLKLQALSRQLAALAASERELIVKAIGING